MSRPTILLTRPRFQAERFAAALAARLGGSADIVIAPLMKIDPLPVAASPEQYAGLIFTSENGVAAFAADFDRRAWPVWCVGDRTAEAARQAGFDEIRSAAAEGGDAEALLQLLLDERPAEPLLHLRGCHARGDLAPRLTAHGLHCDWVAVYDQIPLPMAAAARALLARHGTVVVPVFSPRSAGLFLAEAGAVHARLYPMAISAAAAAVWNTARPEQVALAARPDAEAMLDLVVATVNELSA